MKETASEVAQLLQSIDLQFESAARGLHGTAFTGSHDFIVARAHTSLAQLIGAEEASKIIFEHYTHYLEPEGSAEL